LTPGAIARAAVLAIAAAAGTVALGSPRFTWENAGLRVDHPPQLGAAAALAAAAVVCATWSARPRAARVVGLAAGAVLAVLAAHRFAWRVEALDAGLRERTLAGWNTMAWSDVEAVESSATVIRLRGRKGNRLDLATRGFGAEDRTRLERTIARRIREAPR
jgi:hypothetical protein